MKRLALVALLLLATPAWAQVKLDSSKPDRTRVGALEFRGAVIIPPGKEKVGGLSGLYVSDDGKQLTALSDIGQIYQGQLQWDERGWLTGVTLDPAFKLKNTNGGKFPKRADTESLARLPDGSWLVGFERDHRIFRYPTLKGTPEQVEAPANLQRDLPRNEGLESLVSFPDGKRLTLAEKTEPNGHHRGWLWQDGHWMEFDYAGAPGFQPSDAAYLHPGTVLVLERRVNIFALGFEVVVMELDVHDLTPGKTVKGREIARLSYPLLVDNFEGIYTHMGPDGLPRIYLVSDDNFNGIQQTILAVFSLSWVTH